MPGNHGYSPHLAATRYRALGIVVLAHLALGWWLLRGIAPLERPVRQSALAPVLIQEVTVAAPAPAPVATLPPQPQPRPQPSPAAAAMRQPDAKARARVAARPEPAPRSAAAAQREARPDATVMTTAPTTTTTTTTLPMVSRVLPSAEPATLSAPVPAPAAGTVGQPAPSTAPPSTAAPGPARSGTSLPAQPPAQPSVPPRTEPGTGAVSAAIALVCPTQVVPVMPEFARRAGITGVVEARVVVVDGLVREVTILSGPPMFHNAVRDAMRQYRCIANQTEVWGIQSFTFR